MNVRSPAQWFLDVLASIFPKSALWRGALTLAFMAIGAALVFVEFSSRQASKAKLKDSIIEREVRKGQRGANLPIGVNQ